MKKTQALLIFLLAMALLPWAASAEAPKEPHALTFSELVAWCQTVFQGLDPKSTPEVALDDIFAFDTDFGVVEASAASLEGHSAEVLLHIELSNATLADPRGLRVGDSVEAVLAAYPGGDVALNAWTTPLYAVEGDELQWGWAASEGPEIVDLRYAVALPDTETDGLWRELGLIYSVAEGKVTCIRVYGLNDRIEEAEARADFLTAQITAAWSGEATPFNETDLTFNGLNLLESTPNDIKELFGDPTLDEFIQTEGLRVMSYADMLFELRIGADNAISFNALLVHQRTLPGPRGINIGDSLDSVLERFAREGEGDLLYGESIDTPPFGLLTQEEDGGVVVRYCIQLTGQDTRRMMLHLSFRNGALTEYLLYAFEPEV